MAISKNKYYLLSQVQMMHSTPKRQISSKKKRKRNLGDKIADSLDEAKKLLQSINKEDADSAFQIISR